jgi:nucleoside-triphosphatase THEP1
MDKKIDSLHMCLDRLKDDVNEVIRKTDRGTSTTDEAFKKIKLALDKEKLSTIVEKSLSKALHATFSTESKIVDQVSRLKSAVESLTESVEHVLSRETRFAESTPCK